MDKTLPESWGRGVWFTLHRWTANMKNTPENADAFREMLDVVLRGLPCGNCARHAVSYLERNPPVFNDQDPYWAFRWTVAFHNAVNARIQKPLMSFGEAYLNYVEPKENETNILHILNPPLNH